MDDLKDEETTFVSTTTPIASSPNANHLVGGKNEHFNDGMFSEWEDLWVIGLA